MMAETFLSLDLDSLHVSSLILAVGPLLDEQRTQDRATWVQRSMTLLENMISAGNLVAASRKAEMQQLDDMMNEILDGRDTMQQSPNIPYGSSALQTIFHPSNLPGPQDSIALQPLNMINIGNGDDISADQILAIAGSIQQEDVEWMDRAIADNSIW